ncbi:MAG: hypothetical protein IKE06_07055 [Solobacterium sp.]|nr:hypothetical protein [Solobacterium sp.]MBR3127328.1 hypothetical protein [Solobacterium sp.]
MLQTQTQEQKQPEEEYWLPDETEEQSLEELSKRSIAFRPITEPVHRDIVIHEKDFGGYLLAAGCLLGGLIPTLYALFQGFPAEELISTAWPLVPGIIFLIDAFRHRTIFAEEFLTIRKYFGRTKYFRYDEVDFVWNADHQLEIRTKDGRIIDTIVPYQVDKYHLVHYLNSRGIAIRPYKK